MKKFRVLTLLLAVAVGATAFAQTPKWYKFDKTFIQNAFASTSAMAEFRATQPFGFGPIHTVSCGGKDGELHIGIPAAAILGGAAGRPVSGPADAAEEFGVVAEPPNVTSSLRNQLAALAGPQVSFFGYYRVWNEGHDVGGAAHPSNPNHVLEIHPAWEFRSGTQSIVRPDLVFAMPNYRGYGATKFRPLLKSIVDDEWLRVAEDQDFLYVQLKKAQNFYQLPVTVKQTNPITNGIEAVVDVFSDAAHTKLRYADLTVVAAQGTPAAGELTPGKKTFLLGLFSVNLRKALAAASGHSRANAVFAPGALEFFAFGRPKKKAVASCP